MLWRLTNLGPETSLLLSISLGAVDRLDTSQCRTVGIGDSVTEITLSVGFKLLRVTLGQGTLGAVLSLGFAELFSGTSFQIRHASAVHLNVSIYSSDHRVALVIFLVFGAVL